MARPDAGHHIGQKFSLIEKFTYAAKRAVSIPVIAKMTPNITDMLPAALAAQDGGADGISAINTVKSISHLDMDMGIALPNIQQHSAISGFSGKGCRHIGLRFVAELGKDPRLKIPISGMGGIYTWKDSVEYLMLGASNLQATTSVMHHGVRIVEDLKDGLRRHLAAKKVQSVQDLVGTGRGSLVDPSMLDTKTEVVSLIDSGLCVGCGACEVACRDGAAQAISLVSRPASACGEAKYASARVAQVDERKCVGCELCDIVCPVGAVSFSVRNRIDRPNIPPKSV
jgi:dihydropyrimidine dehydrogenase (NAD+) subunit PreA